jgi:hypothetical protein
MISHELAVVVMILFNAIVCLSLPRLIALMGAK